MTPRVPVDDKTADWPRKVAQAINRLIGKAVERDGQTIYTAPTISDPPTQAQVQAIADALEAVSDRLK
ncbi:hypothetical protein [Pelagerythrobacter marinus]|uniref:Uncharacterized protein n=1 Tax=Pelagerythrobacter marinus TaxID=538382 RepID=A0ABW9UTR3_9SPHN|nr:hypothetical protein [Pelagerythrobacter marinus]MXO67788.1 hypothetical protein [Pelagerythrobacter marinus]WPZ05490.1 hypothetical protein T8T98_08595 [Pelagerythrobacter marinus]